MAVTPFDQAAALYARYPQPRTFAEDLRAHFSTGYVVSTPEYFLMGRAVDRFAAPELIENPWHAFPAEQHNTWLVYLFVGKRRSFLDFVPHLLPWLAWQRRGRPLRFYDFEVFRNRVRRRRTMAVAGDASGKKNELRSP